VKMFKNLAPPLLDKAISASDLRKQLMQHDQLEKWVNAHSTSQ